MKKLADLWRFIVHLKAEYGAAGCQHRAAALTYMTLFAIVPMLMVIYSAFSVIPAFQGYGAQLQNLLFTHLVPDTGSEIQVYLTEFSSQARSLTGWGVGMLVVTAYLMLKNIEKTFNGIWGVDEARRGLSNFLLYWAILSLGPLLLGIGLGTNTYLLSLRLFVDEYDSLGVVPFLLQFLPWLLTSAAFTLLFAAVPNCKVSIKNSMIGGVITAVCFELAKELFAWVVANSSFTAIYGAFAMVPLFLLWVNILWMIVLAGAVLVKSLSTYGKGTSTQHCTDFIAGLSVLWLFYQKQKTGESLRDDLFQQVELDLSQWQRLRKYFLEHRVIALTQEEGYILCRDLHEFTLSQLAKILSDKPKAPINNDYLEGVDWLPDVVERVENIDRHTDKQLNVSLATVFEAKKVVGPLRSVAKS